jgi:hypothetical protein
MINTISLYALVAWGCLAVVSLLTDSIIIYRTLTGRNGEPSPVLFLEIAARHGGTRRWIAKSLMWDILQPWLIWRAMLSARR